MLRHFVLAIVSASALGACTMSPVDGQTVGAAPVSFYGYAVEPFGELKVQVRDPGTGSWLDRRPTDAPVLASRIPVTLNRNLYQWTAQAVLPAECFGPDGLAHVRVLEVVGASEVPTYMFDQDGRACIDRAVHSTADLRTLNADDIGHDCSKGRTEVTLRRGPGVGPSITGLCNPYDPAAVGSGGQPSR